MTVPVPPGENPAIHFIEWYSIQSGRMVLQIKPENVTVVDAMVPDLNREERRSRP